MSAPTKLADIEKLPPEQQAAALTPQPGVVWGLAYGEAKGTLALIEKLPQRQQAPVLVAPGAVRAMKENGFSHAVNVLQDKALNAQHFR